MGLGKSGVASALFLQGRGARVTVSDAKPQDQLGNEISVLLDHGIAVETGGHGERTFRGQDLIVVSPGVPVDSPPLVQARTLGAPVIGELELASQFLPRKLVAITGSNGKTTTTTLTGEIIVANSGDNSILFFAANANGDVAPLRVLAGPATNLKGATGVAIDTKHNELWVTSWENHMAAVFPRNAEGNVPPLRVIHSAPKTAPPATMGRLGAVAFDSKRQEILAPN